MRSLRVKIQTIHLVTSHIVSMSDYELVTPSSFCEQNWSDSNDILDEIIKGEKENQENGNFD